MADDIVIRLRSEHRMALAPLHMSDAADEIERLRAVVDSRLRVALDNRETLDQLIASEAQNRKLRAAGDALAYGVGEWFGERISDEMCGLVAAWEEARRG